MPPVVEPKSLFILGASSDIGWGLAQRYKRDGWDVFGTYRQLKNIAEFETCDGVELVSCDVDDPASIADAISAYRKLGRSWDLFIASVGTMEPIGPFFELNFDDWQQSITINALSTLRVLHGLYPLRRTQSPAHVAFFAGGGTNGPVTNFSAYCASKITLIKMCELLDDEAKDLNIFIVGPGFVQTKIHDEALRAKGGAGPGYQKTIELLKTPGTSLDDIFANINWCIAQGREVAGGRNFATVHDPWRKGGEKLAAQLKTDSDLFKLRRTQKLTSS